jgi:hypothetical protein
VTECYSVRADVHPRKLGRAGPTAARPSASCPGRVEYRVVGSARLVDITMENRQNNTEQRDDVPVPFRTSGGTMDLRRLHLHLGAEPRKFRNGDL